MPKEADKDGWIPFKKTRTGTSYYKIKGKVVYYRGLSHLLGDILPPLEENKITVVLPPEIPGRS